MKTTIIDLHHNFSTDSLTLKEKYLSKIILIIEGALKQIL